ncbi:MAG: ferrochelatase [Candidatus Micrarchaeota archaeon]|nr:ferrochelatase [Candidatus Micrarchaeota archaeon]
MDGSSVAILLMVYGSPASEDEVEPYYTAIRHGKRPTDAEIEDLKARYERIGGCSPLMEITEMQARQLERRLNRVEGSSYKVYVGTKHWKPSIKDAVSQIIEAKHTHMVAMPLAPHNSSMTTQNYNRLVEEALNESGRPIEATYVNSWSTNGQFINALSSNLSETLDAVGNDAHVLFTAHSLPERILADGDPYPFELMETCDKVAATSELADWSFCYQSAGHASEKWLGPDITEKIAELAKGGSRNIVVCTVGFVSDNLEILYDIDIEARELASRLGVNLIRTESLNLSSKLTEALADVVSNALRN